MRRLIDIDIPVTRNNVLVEEKDFTGAPWPRQLRG
jgi:hypothetical protein